MYLVHSRPQRPRHFWSSLVLTRRVVTLCMGKDRGFWGREWLLALQALALRLRQQRLHNPRAYPVEHGTGSRPLGTRLAIAADTDKIILTSHAIFPFRRTVKRLCLLLGNRDYITWRVCKPGDMVTIGTVADITTSLIFVWTVPKPFLSKTLIH